MEHNASVFAQVCELPNGSLGLKVLEIDFGTVKVSSEECLKYPIVTPDDDALLREKLAGHNIKGGNVHVVITIPMAEETHDKCSMTEVALCNTPYYNVAKLGEMVKIMQEKFLK